jgi:hypothetical protein
MQAPDPHAAPPWWDFARQIIIFGLAVYLIVYAALSPGHDVPFLITGLIMMGIVPVDTYMNRRANRRELKSNNKPNDPPAEPGWRGK